MMSVSDVSGQLNAVLDGLLSARVLAIDCERKCQDVVKTLRATTGQAANPKLDPAAGAMVASIGALERVIGSTQWAERRVTEYLQSIS